MGAAGAWSACAVLLPHARAVLDLTSDGRWQMARYLGSSGSYPAARDLWRLTASAFQDSEDYGPEYPETLTARHNLAIWTGEAGDAAGARDQLAVLLPVRERVLGAEHPDTLTTRSNFAHWTGLAGDADSGREMTGRDRLLNRRMGRRPVNDLAGLPRWSGGAPRRAGRQGRARRGRASGGAAAPLLF